MLILDVYVFQGVRAVSYNNSPRARSILFIVYWGLTLLSVLALLAFVYTAPDYPDRKLRSYIFAIIVGLFLAKLIASVFFLTDDLRRGLQWIVQKLFLKAPSPSAPEVDGISRSAFLSWLGLAAGSTIFGGLLFGFRNKYNYQVKKLNLTFQNLPESFRGLKILHFSDVHCGSFMDKKAVERGFAKIMEQEADIILFTGDLINDRATEVEGYMEVFSTLKAPMGVYSTLGNHDYGDYINWPSEGVSKQQNLENLKSAQEKLGWRLLMNEHIALERNGETIALLGVENWSAKSSFIKRGRMDLAYEGTEKHPFKILMSHDPSHWEAEVKEKYKDVDLMLSGHTHGMQFGVEVPGFKWSPVQYFYRQWAGLYKSDKQHLYVNRGFGFIGYPGRVGILPEITVITLG